MTTKSFILTTFLQNIDATEPVPTDNYFPSLPCQRGLKAIFRRIAAPALVIKAWITTHPLDWLPLCAEHLLIKTSLLIYSGGYNDEEFKDLILLATGEESATKYYDYLFKFLRREQGYSSILQPKDYKTDETYLQEVIVEYLFDELFPRNGVDAETLHHQPPTKVLKLLDLPADWTPFNATNWSYWNYGIVHRGFEPKKKAKRSRSPSHQSTEENEHRSRVRGGELSPSFARAPPEAQQGFGSSRDPPLTRSGSRRGPEPGLFDGSESDLSS